MYFFAGNGASFGSAQSGSFTSTQVFTGLRWVYGASNAITTDNRNGNAWNMTGLTGTPFAQNVAYTVSIVGNNSASAVSNYDGNGNNVASGKCDLWINGVLVGNDLAKGELSTSSNINAFRFYGESSTSNVAELRLDNVRWWNSCVAPSVSVYSTLTSVPANNYTDLNVNSGSGTLAGNVAVNGILTLNDNLNLNAKTLTLTGGSNGAITGTGARTINSTGNGTIDVTTSNTAISGVSSLLLGGSVTLQTSKGINFGASLTTINGAFQLNSGGFVNTNAPIYGSPSILIYNAGGIYGVGAEWTGNSTTAGLGVPQNVTIQNNTTVRMPNANRGLAGSLHISSGTLELNATSGDLYLAGNWTRASAATFTPNERAVFFNGLGTQPVRVTGGGTETFNYLLVQGSSTIQLDDGSNATNITVNRSGGLTLGSSAANNIDLNGQTMTLSGGGNLSVSNDTRRVTSSVAGGSFVISDAVTTVTNGGGLVFRSNVTVKLSNGFNPGAGLTTIEGTLQINNGGFVSTNAPTYGTSSLLQYNSGTNPYGRGVEWGTASSGAGYPNNVQVSSNTTLSYPNGSTAARFMRGNLTVDAGSSFYMDYGSPGLTNPLTVNGTVNLNGNLSMGDTNGGDIKVGGDWLEGAAAVLNSNNRALILFGTAPQIIARDNGAGTNTFAYLQLDKTGGDVGLFNNVTVNNGLTFTLSNTANIDATLGALIVNNSFSGAIDRSGSAAGHVIGNLQRAIATGTNTYLFPVGTLEGYTPVSLAFNSVGTGGNLTVNSNDANHPNFATYGLSATKYVSRHWNVTNNGVASFNVNATFDYLAGDLQGGAIASEMRLGKYDAAWTYPTRTTGTNSITGLGITSFSGFMAGACGTVDATITAANAVCSGSLANIASAPLIVGAAYAWSITNGTITNPSGVEGIQYTAGTSGTVTLAVTVTNAAGCSANSSKMVTINPLPVVTISGGGAVCSGQPLPDVTFTFTGPAPVNLFYSDGTNPFLPSIPSGNTYTITNAPVGTYETLSFSDANGCEATQIGTPVTVSVNPLPNAGTITGTTSICVDETTTLSSDGAANGVWSSDDLAVATVNPTSGLVTGVEPGSAVITYTVTDANTCVSSTMTTVTVVDQPTTADAGPDQTGVATCGSTQVTLAANTPTVGTGVWSIESGTGGSLGDADSPISTFSGTAGNTYTLRWTVSNSPCTASTDEMVVTFNQNTTTANAGQDVFICQTATSYPALNGMVGGGAPGGTWSGGAGTFSPNANTLNATYIPSAGELAAAANVILTLTANNPGPCPLISDQLTYHIGQAAAVNAGPDQTVCASNPVVQLAATFGGATTNVVWDINPPFGAFSNDISPTSTYTLAAADITAGSVTLTIRTNDPAGACEGVSDEMTIFIDPAATVNAGQDVFICQTATTFPALNGMVGGGASSGTWSGGAGTFSPDANTLNATYIPSAGELASGGTVTLTLTTNDPAGPCPAVSDQLVYNIGQAATVNAGPDQTVCASNPVVQLAATFGGATTNVVWDINPPFGAFSNDISPTSTYTLAAADITAGSVTLTIRTNDPAGACEGVSDEMTIFIKGVPVANAGLDQTGLSTCGLTQVTLAANTPVAGTGVWSIQSGTGGSFSNANSPASTFNGVAGATYTLRWTVSNAPCAAATDEMTVTFNLNSTANAGLDQTLCPNTATTLAATSTNGTGTWSVTSGPSTSSAQFNNISLATATFTPAGGNGTYILRWSVGNGVCNAVFDEVNIVVGPCQATFDGRIIWSRNGTTGVKDVTVALSGSQSATTVTPVSGNYSLVVSPGATFTITPTKALNKLNGINALDVTRITQHASVNPILLTNPYDWVAADVNSNNVITQLDANIVQLSLLGNPQALAQWIHSWRFVPTTHTMTLPPWGFPEKVTLMGSAANVDFYGIKIGDLVSNFANPANAGQGQPLILRTPDQILEAGQTLQVEFAADALSDIAALQFALRFDPAHLQLANIAALDGLPLAADNFGTYEVEAGSVRVVWGGLSAVALKQTTPVFRLTFNVLESSSRLSEVLGLDDETLPGHVYNSQSAESGVLLRFDASTAVGDPAGHAGVQLLQNQPNPFVDKTTIGFVLPAACKAQLRIVDAAGRLLAERTQQYPAGRHQESFDLSGVSGVLYYELTTPFGVQTKKMVVVEK